MPIYSTNARSSCRKKALITSAALMACALMSVASADATAEVSARALRALEQLDKTDPGSVHPYVQSTSDDIPSDQERMVPLSNPLLNPFKEATEKAEKLTGVVDGLPEGLSKFFGEAHWTFRWWKVLRLRRLYKRSKTINQWVAIAVESWIKSVRDLFPEQEEKLTNVIFSILDSRMRPDDLIDFAYSKLGTLTHRVLKVQRQNWVSAKKTDEEIFDLLYLQKIGYSLIISGNKKFYVEEDGDESLTSLMKSTIFEQWEEFVFEKGPELGESPYHRMQTIWSKRFPHDNWDLTIAAAKHLSPNGFVHKLHDLQMEKWKVNTKTTLEDVIKVLHLDNVKSDEVMAENERKVTQLVKSGKLNQMDADKKLTTNT